MPNQDRKQNSDQESFVGQEDRPAVKLNPDMPLGELKVRDLGQLLGGLTLKRYIPDKHVKAEKWEHPKHEKFEKWEHPKLEKLEKWEHLKHEIKDILEPGPKHVFEPGPDPKLGREPGPDWGQLGREPIDQLIQHVSRLTEQVEKLSAQVNELQQKG